MKVYIVGAGAVGVVAAVAAAPLGMRIARTATSSPVFRARREATPRLRAPTERH